MSKREELERCLGDVYRELDKVKEQQQLLFPEGRLLFTTEVGKKMVPLIEREEELTDLGFVPSITSIEAYDENMAWYKSRLDRNHVEEEAAKVLQGEKVKETKEVVKARLSNLR